MMISVPDTAFGAALGKFLLLFTKRPLVYSQLHLAYAALGELAAREHPKMQWPLEITDEGVSYSLTVEGILARKSKFYAGLPIVDDLIVQEACVPWKGAKVEFILVGSEESTGFRLQLVKKGRPRIKGFLAIECPWKLIQADSCSSDDEKSYVDKRVSMLKGTTVVSSCLEPGGILVLMFTNGSRLEVCPDDIIIGPDYFLNLEHQTYYRFGGNFVARHTSELNGEGFSEAE